MEPDQRPVIQNCPDCGSTRLDVAECDCLYLPEGWLELVDVCLDCRTVTRQGLPPWREAALCTEEIVETADLIVRGAGK